MWEWEWQTAKIEKGILKNKFVIVMPAFNAQETIEDAVLSVIHQDFQDLAIIIRDDLSTDRTAETIRSLFDIESGEDDFYIRNNARDIIYVSNKTKLYSGGNIYESIIDFVDDPYTIIGQVDADDHLIVENAVSIIYNAYQSNPEKWLIWSQHISRVQAMMNSVGFSLPLPPDDVIYSTRRYWGISHFRTFLAGLLLLIDPADLRDPVNANEYAKICGDASMLYAMAEMCGNSHSLFINEALYFYNDGIPTNDAEVYKPELEFYKWYFENKPSYAPLSSNFIFKK